MTRPAAIGAPAGPHWIWRSLALALGALFLASVARFYHPGMGFTALIGFPEGHGYELPALQGVPHQVSPGNTSYDGQFYAQLALEPLLRDPLIDRAMDNAPYRARRILFSWTAYLLGFGRPAWILEVFALQNVGCWLLLAWLLTRWIPPQTPRGFALWSASMFAHGLVWSVRFSLLDGPSLLIIAGAVAAAERRRLWTAAALVGVGGLGRETNLLAVSLLEWPRDIRQGVRAVLLAGLVGLPLLIWQDYLWSIYRATSLAGGDQLAPPFTAYVSQARVSIAGIRHGGLTSPHMLSLLTQIALSVQAVFVFRRWRTGGPWWRVSAPYAILMLLVDPVVWGGHPGAITRVVLPLTFGFNVLLARQSRGFWVWFVLGNLHLVSALHVLPIQ